MAGILLIDDEPWITVALRRILEGAGYQIAEAGEKIEGTHRA